MSERDGAGLGSDVRFRSRGLYPLFLHISWTLLIATKKLYCHPGYTEKGTRMDTGLSRGGKASRTAHLLLSLHTYESESST